MADKTKRRRLRVANASGAPDDKAKYLQALLRTGEVTPEEVALAAHLRHKSAALMVGQDTRDEVHIHHWAAGLARFGKRVMVQAGYALALKCLPLAQQNRYDWREPLQHLVDCAAAWLRNEDQAVNTAQALAVSHQIEGDMAELTLLGLNSRAMQALTVVVNLGLLLNARECDPMRSFTPLQLWNERPADPAWLCFVRMVWTTAWIADNSSRGLTTYVSTEPCRPATLHTIKFLRSRMLDQKWKSL